LAIPAALSREEPSGRRREERWRVRLGARWLDSRPETQLVTIHDVSPSGLLLETDEPLRTGSHLIIEMPGEITKICKTVWSSGKLRGATFAEPLTDAEMRELINSSPVIWPSFGRGMQPPTLEQSTDTSREISEDYHIDDIEKLPIAARLAIIVGTTIALWALICLGVWLAFW